MERIAGQTLAEMIGHHGIELRQALRLAMQVADAITTRASARERRTRFAGSARRSTARSSGCCARGSGPVDLGDLATASRGRCSRVSERSLMRSLPAQRLDGHPPGPDLEMIAPVAGIVSRA